MNRNGFAVLKMIAEIVVGTAMLVASFLPAFDHIHPSERSSILGILRIGGVVLIVIGVVRLLWSRSSMGRALAQSRSMLAANGGSLAQALAQMRNLQGASVAGAPSNVAADRALFMSGQRAVGVITSVQQSYGSGVNAMTTIGVHVVPTSAPQFDATKTLLVPYNSMPNVGEEIHVAYQPANSAYIALEAQWDVDTKGGEALLSYPPGTLTGGRPMTSGAFVPVQAMPLYQPASSPSDEQVAAMQALLTARDTGAIDEATFQHARARLMEPRPPG